MTISVSDIISSVNLELNEQTRYFYTTEELISYINEALFKAFSILDLKSVEKTISISEGANSFEIPESVLSITRMTYNNTYTVNPVTVTYLDTHYPGWEANPKGIPDYYFIRNQTVILNRPVYKTANIIYEYFSAPDLISSDTDIIPIADSLKNSLVAFVKSRVVMKEWSDTLLTEALKYYKDSLNDMTLHSPKQKQHRRGQIARIKLRRRV